MIYKNKKKRKIRNTKGFVLMLVLVLLITTCIPANLVYAMTNGGTVSGGDILNVQLDGQNLNESTVSDGNAGNIATSEAGTETVSDGNVLTPHRLIMVNFEALEKEAREIDPDATDLFAQCEDLYLRLYEVYDIAYDYADNDEISLEELDEIDAKFVEILTYLEDTYGYEYGLTDADRQTLEIQAVDGFTLSSALDGKIVYIRDGYYAVTNRMVEGDYTAYGNATTYPRLDADEKDEGMPWLLTAVSGVEGAYYVQDLATGKYLDINKSTAGLTETAVETYIYANNSNAKYALAQIKDGTYYCLNLLGGSGQTEYGGYNGSIASQATFTLTNDYHSDNLDGKSIYLFNKLEYNALTTGLTSDSNYFAANTASANKYIALNAGIVSGPETYDAFTITAVNANNDIYYMQNAEGKYLKFNGSSVELTDTPVKTYIFKYDSTYGFMQMDSDNQMYYLNQIGGASYDRFGGWKVQDFESGLIEDGSLFYLISHRCDLTLATGLAGREVYMFNKLTLYSLSNTSENGKIPVTTEKDKYMKYRLNHLNDSDMENVAKWTFEKVDAEDNGFYYVKEVRTGKYFSIDSSNDIVLGSNKTPIAVYRQTGLPENIYSFNIGNRSSLNQYGGSTSTYFKTYPLSEGTQNDAGNWFYFSDAGKTARASDYNVIASADENIKMSVFNYNTNVNTPIDGMGYMTFYQITSWEPSVDGYRYWNEAANDYYKVGTPAMNRILNEYPEIASANGDMSVGSLRYLFDDGYNTTTAYTVNNTERGTGLFQLDEQGFYVYDSAKNAAYFQIDEGNSTTGQFELYDYILRPAHVYYPSNLNQEQVGNFLPFNQGHTAGVEDYRTRYYDYTAQVWKSEPIPDDPTALQDKNAFFTSKGQNPNAYPDAYRLLGGSPATYTDLWFGMNLEFEFNMPADGMATYVDSTGKEQKTPMVFEFHGDDDVWVYIDDVLILDIGGTHAAESASVNFATGQVNNPGGDYRLGSGTLYSLTKEAYEAANKEFDESDFVDSDGDGTKDTFADWTKHNLKFYYMERGGNISYCKLRFNMLPLPDGGLSVSKAMDSSSVYTAETASAETKAYQFVLEKLGSDGTTYTPVGGYTYTLNGAASAATDANGGFTLKPGETALFEISTTNEGELYRVREILEDSDKVYMDLKEITYQGDDAGKVLDAENYHAKLTIRPTDTTVHNLVFTNALKEACVTVTKEVTGSMGDRSKEFAFTAKIYSSKADYDAKNEALDFPTPSGSEAYTLTEDKKTAAFTLKHDGTITIDDIPYGAYVVIEEQDDGTGYSTSYRLGSEAKVSGKAVAFKATNTHSAAYTNHKEVVVDTGISLDTLPYIIMIAIVVVGGIVFLVFKRRRDDED